MTKYVHTARSGERSLSKREGSKIRSIKRHSSFKFSISCRLPLPLENGFSVYVEFFRLSPLVLALIVLQPQNKQEVIQDKTKWASSIDGAFVQSSIYRLSASEVVLYVRPTTWCYIEGFKIAREFVQNPTSVVRQIWKTRKPLGNYVEHASSGGKTSRLQDFTIAALCKERQRKKGANETWVFSTRSKRNSYLFSYRPQPPGPRWPCRHTELVEVWNKARGTSTILRKCTINETGQKRPVFLFEVSTLARPKKVLISRKEKRLRGRHSCSVEMSYLAEADGNSSSESFFAALIPSF